MLQDEPLMYKGLTSSINMTAVGESLYMKVQEDGMRSCLCFGVRAAQSRPRRLKRLWARKTLQRKTYHERHRVEGRDGL